MRENRKKMVSHNIEIAECVQIFRCASVKVTRYTNEWTINWKIILEQEKQTPKVVEGTKRP